MKRIALVLSFCLAACGAPGDVLSIGEPTADAQKAAAAGATDSTVAEAEPGPLDGEWVGGWSRVYSAEVYHNAQGALCGHTRTVTFTGTLLIDGAAASVTGSIVDDAYRWTKPISTWYCQREVETISVSQALAVTVNANSVDIACAPADCGGGVDDWKIGPAGGDFDIVAVRLDADTRIQDKTSSVFQSFEFFRK